MTKGAGVAQRKSNRLVSGRLWVRFPSSAQDCAFAIAFNRLVELNLQRVRAGAQWKKKDGYPSGQRGLTVNQLAYAFGGSNPPPSNFASIISPGLIIEAKLVARIELALRTLTRRSTTIHQHVTRPITSASCKP